MNLINSKRNLITRKTTSSLRINLFLAWETIHELIKRLKERETWRTLSELWRRCPQLLSRMIQSLFFLQFTTLVSKSNRTTISNCCPAFSTQCHFFYLQLEGASMQGRAATDSTNLHSIRWNLAELLILKCSFSSLDWMVQSQCY